MFHELVCKIAQGFDWLVIFPIERNNGVYFRERKNCRATKDSARAHHTHEIFGLARHVKSR
jgi:hypothetical protein